MNQDKQPEALRLADMCKMGHSYDVDLFACSAELRRQHARIVELEAKLAAANNHIQQGMDAIAALQKVRDIAVSALLTGSLDRQDWIDDMDRIAAQAKQWGA